MLRKLFAAMVVTYAVLFVFLGTASALEPKVYPRMMICGEPHKVTVDQYGVSEVKELTGEQQEFVRTNIKPLEFSRVKKTQAGACVSPKTKKVASKAAKKFVPPAKPAKVKKSNEGVQNRPAAKPAANASATVATFDPTKPHGFWSRLLHGVMWIITGEWNKPVTPAIMPAPATTQVVPPAKPLKKRVINKRGPPKTSKCKQDEIKVMKLTPPAPKPPLKILAAQPCPPAGIPKPALSKVSAITSEPNRLLTDWEVREKTFQITKDGKKELVKDYLRSPAECFDRVKPGYKKSNNELTIRYDRHKYDLPTEKPVASGTVVQYALDQKPGDLTMNHITRDAGEKMEILDVALGQFTLVDKPRATQVEYLTPYHKSFKTVRVMPSKELYEFTDRHRVTDAELAKVRAEYANRRG